MNHHANIMQATYIWGAAMEKVVEGKESAAEKATLLKEATVEKVTLLKEATVEKVNSMKENVDDAIAPDSPVRKNSQFSVTLMVITMTTLQALEATWFGLGSSGKGQLDESQVLKINHQQDYCCVISRQVRVALAFYTILGAAIFIFLGLLIYAFINGGLRGGKKIKEDAKDTSVKDSEEEDSEED